MSADQSPNQPDFPGVFFIVRIKVRRFGRVDTSYLQSLEDDQYSDDFLSFKEIEEATGFTSFEDAQKYSTLINSTWSSRSVADVLTICPGQMGRA